MIFPLEQPGFNIGVMHGSHMSPLPIHSGSMSKVHVPFGSVLLFHNDLYHFGDHTLMDGGKCTTSLRAFCYVFDGGYKAPVEKKTYHLGPNDLCEDKTCSSCQDISGILMQCDGEGHGAWRPIFHPCFLRDAGIILHGSMNELVWVILQGAIPNNEALNFLQQELFEVTGEKWVDLQSKIFERKMKFDAFRTEPPTWIESINGTRKMYNSEQMNLDDFSCVK